ncbi:hypothetical protein TVAG_395510 [Trichomonas vaginalis G3]|uniref:TFIIE beta domain-containing protein n=1 Tax=Trichomonas vaginalis (strain ATCC PRA-98 / G3) TaxID=412133 RepID=A2F1E0_TRIV3|nr:transcription initiation factor IIE subunit beta family [Trichomonas vaginalis G3]EAY01304.1 hypothetical protein TVAG_395510 [Trichomonas vaginalis G3]KAI5542834.1 transcription initiation factor IIE subunit beta family [Trichomonas vaginalis G3]|eukprot:XP_001330172.1 hypothetical protein [Trichomonas vaginalis G3]
MEDLDALVNSSTQSTKKHKKEKKEKKSELKKMGALNGPTGALRFMAQDNRRIMDPTIARQNNISKIIEYLESRKSKGKAPCTLSEIEKELKIKVSDDDDLVAALQKNESIVYEYNKYSFKTEHQTGNENELLNSLRKERFVDKSTFLQGAFEGADKELDDLKDQGIIDIFKGDQKNKVIFYYDEILREDEEVLAAKEFSSLWHSEFTIIPAEDEFRDKMCRENHIEPVKALKPLNQQNEEPVEKKRRTRKQTFSSSNQKFLE